MILSNLGGLFKPSYTALFILLLTYLSGDGKLGGSVCLEGIIVIDAFSDIKDWLVRFM